jgi:hypothetical protein
MPKLPVGQFWVQLPPFLSQMTALAESANPRTAWDRAGCMAVELRSFPPPSHYNLSLRSILAEGVGFEPTVTSLPRSISSRVPSTGLSHPSY